MNNERSNDRSHGSSFLWSGVGTSYLCCTCSIEAHGAYVLVYLFCSVGSQLTHWPLQAVVAESTGVLALYAPVKHELSTKPWLVTGPIKQRKKFVCCVCLHACFKTAWFSTLCYQVYKSVRPPLGCWIDPHTLSISCNMEQFSTDQLCGATRRILGNPCSEVLEAYGRQA